MYFYSLLRDPILNPQAATIIVLQIHSLILATDL